ncbi:polysaccharide biosynthesis/export family protein [Flavobacterium sp.]|uniref:polysaccharide biosynthesis/export family protein n=1 Tax=Flavobacterium sp. TaxID=239 RepID=UPI00375126F8
MKKQYLYFALILCVFFTSCISKKKIVYLQGNQNFNNTSTNYDPLIQNDDRLSIIVSTLEVEASVPFNLNQTQNAALSSNSNNIANSYLVDINGNIDFPVLGTIAVSGYSIDQFKQMLRERLSLHLKDPVVNIAILNFKVTVLGDVTSPGIKTFNNHRITLLDALAASGDLTIFGKRDNILLIRDFQGVKTYNRLDITQADFVNSPFYYLDQNDVIYVEARKGKIDASALPNLPIILSVITFITTALLLLTK